MRRSFLVLAVLMLTPGVASAGGGGHSSGCAGFGEGTTVSMRDSCFEGTAHFVPGGTTIRVSNDGSLPHTLTAVDGTFDTGQVAAGTTTELTIDEPGIYRVFCALHGSAQGAGMAGVLVVGEAAPSSVADPSGMSPISAAVDRDASSSVPQVVTVTNDVGPVSLVVLLMVGLASSLALAALLMVVRFRFSERSAGSLERLEPSVES